MTTRDYDTTQLHENGHGKTLHRDYTAHFFRWSFARRFITSKDRVLEVGCGQDKPLSKILTGGAAAHVNHYTGVDLNKLKPSNSQRLKFIGEFNFVERWQELERDYDVVVSFEVIEHMAKPFGLQYLAGIFELLRRGGTFLISTPAYDGVRMAKNHIHEWTIGELQEAIEDAGFTIEKRFGTFMDIRHIGKANSELCSKESILEVRKALEQYFDNDAISNFFGPLYKDHSRNNIWVCKK
jgi:SAM-dependent methyltransferase